MITNAHNFAGWDFERDRSLSDSAFTPTEVQVRLSVQRLVEGDAFHLTRTAFSAQLNDEEGRPKWLVHPAHGPKVDVGALSLGDASLLDLWPAEVTKDSLVANPPVNELKELADFDLNAGDDAFVVGYPLGMDGGEEFPLWKRASIASEPAANIDKLPKLLIDTATRKGMSGSPVYAVRSGFITMKSGEQLIGRAPAFLGVYSGRIDDDPLGAQIGIVWKAAVVNEIIDGLRAAILPWEVRG